MRYIHAGTCDSVGYREQARASAHTHTEEGNLSLTRILNGCAETRTVGTHYSTTHPPPLRQNSTSPLLAFLLTLLFPPHCRPALSHPGPPVPHPSMTALPVRATFGVPSLSLLSSFQRARAHTCVHIEAASLYVHICMYMAKGIHM